MSRKEDCMSRKSKNFLRVTVVEKKSAELQKEKPTILQVEEFFISEESKPVGKWGKIKDYIPIIELINKIISLF